MVSMRRKSLVLTVVCSALVVLTAGPLLASGRSPIQTVAPPRNATGEAYLEAVGGRGLQTNIKYIAPEGEQADASDKEEPSEITELGSTKPIGWAIVAIIAALLLFLLYRSRNTLAELAGPRNNSRLPQSGAPEPLEPAVIDHGLIERLRSEPDPRKGLRLVLQRFLALAAQESSIPVKRSLTTREIMARLPGSFGHRETLETLAREVERVVFGGHEIEAAQYQHCLDLAAPFLKRTGA